MLFQFKFRVLALSLSIFTFAPIGSGFLRPLSVRAESQNTVMRLVVMPFKNLTQNPKDQWLGESFAETLTGALSQMSGLDLIERSQIQALLNEQSFSQTALVNEVSAPQLGKLVGAKKLLLGSFQKLGSQIMIQTRVVDVESGQVEKRSFVKVQGAYADLFQLQERLSHQIIQSLKLQNHPLDLKKVSHAIQATDSTAAYEAYHKGLIHGQRVEMDKAIYYLQEAVRLDPQFAKAYADLSEMLSNRYAYRSVFASAKESDMQDALQYAKKAIQLAPQASETYRALAAVYFAQHKLDKAKEYIVQALKNNSRDTKAILDYIKYYFEHTRLRSYEHMVMELTRQGVNVDSPLVQFALIQNQLRLLKEFQKQKKEVNYQPLLKSLMNLEGQMPQNPFIPLKVAEIYGVMGDLERTKIWTEKGISKSPEQFFVYFMAGSVFLPFADQTFARKYLEKSLILNPKLSIAHMMLTFSYLKTAEVAPMLVHAEKASQLNPRSSFSPFLVGRVLFSQKDFGQAKKYYLKALANHGEDLSEKVDLGDILSSLADVLMLEGEYITAETYFKQALAKSSKPTLKTVIGLSFVYREQKKYKLALTLLKTYMDKYPEFLDQSKYTNEYRLVFIMRRHQKDPENPQALNDLASVMMQGKEYKKAEEVLKIALRRAPKNPAVLYNYGTLKMQGKLWKEAESLFEQVLLLKPKYAKAMYNLGYVYFKSGDTKKAKIIWQKLLLLHPQDLDAKKALSQF